ncbi:MAG: hypothetical protein DIU52_013065 [bacterium]|jgi:hypothetical protein|nr:MAG: hypothetical protein DIU52_01595 [bacterium]
MATENPIHAPPFRILERTPPAVRTAIALLLVGGGIGFLFALLSDADRAWRAYHFNWLYWTSIAQGAVIFAAVVAIARGVWARAIRRIALSFVAFLPVALVLFLPILFGARSIFPWIEHPVPGKDVYLNVPFLAVRDLVALGAVMVLSILFAYWSIRPDAGLVRDRVPERLRGLYDRLTRDWRGQQQEEEKAHRKISRIAPALALVYAVGFGFLAWDLVMSLEPHWFSTLIGPYFFMAAVLGGIAATGVLTIIYRGRLGLTEVIDPPQFHDLGKLTFGFCIFWAYLFWSQYLVIWYGKLPWEQEFMIHRLQQPYAPLAVLVFFALFVLPFFGLLGVRPKKTPAILGLFAVIVLVGLWFERYMLVYPSLYQEAEHLVFGWQELVTALPFAGLLIASIMWFATRFPILQVWLNPTDREILGSSAEPPGEVVTAE